MSKELILKNKYVEALGKVEPNEQKIQEFLYKTLQRKKELQASGIIKTESKQKKRFNWKIKQSVIAASVAAVLIFCAVFIPLMANNGGILPHSAERIVIIDASASMRAKQANGKTRFENSVEKARKLGKETIAGKQQVTVILADKKAETVITTKSLDELNSALDSLECAYGRADIDGARGLADGIVSKNKRAKTTLYTAQQYETNDLEVVDVYENEWNAAIVNVSREYEDSVDEISREPYSKFEVAIQNWNKAGDITIFFEAKGVNSEHKTVTSQKTVACQINEILYIKFEGLNIYEYDSVRVYIDVEDSLDSDNEFFLYDGRKDIINILYVSSRPNSFFRNVLLMLRDIMKSQWNIQVTEGVLGEIKLEGYDFYIIEHQMPQKLPTDGLVWLINPDIAPEGSGLELGETIIFSEDKALSAGQPSPITQDVNTEKIIVKKYTEITSYDGYEVLTYCGDAPAFMIKNSKDAKVAVLAFDLHYSNFPLLAEFPVLMFNMFNGMFNYFLPHTITEFVFDVNEEVSINAKGQVLQINNEYGFTQTYTEFPNITVPPVPGSYTLTQTLMSGKIATDKFYTKISASQSDFSRI